MNDMSGSRRASAEQALRSLLEIMATLRDPVGGCAWDVEQTHATIAPYAIEEAYEVAEAIETGDLAGLRDELGDLLLQVVFHSRMAEEAGNFTFTDVTNSISNKLIRRHPHIFADAAQRDATAQTVAWEAQKAEERAAKGKTKVSALDGVAVTLPALTRAQKLSARAARVGFDWPNLQDLFAKLDEEVAELQAEIPGALRERLADEMGDLLFVIANLCRKLGLDGEATLRAANAKFTRRFQDVEARLAVAGRSPAEVTLAEMEDHWAAVKSAETAAQGRG
jgi:ATP diphosphatase